MCGWAPANRRVQECFSGSHTQFEHGALAFLLDLTLSHPFLEEISRWVRAVIHLEGLTCSVGVESWAHGGFSCPDTRKSSQLLQVSLCRALSAFPARRTRPPCKIQLFLDFFEANSI